MQSEQEKQALAIAIREEREHLSLAMENLKRSARAEVERVKDRLDLSSKVSERPWRFLLGGFAVGFVLAFARGR